MTSRIDLLNLAQQHNVPGSKELVTAIKEAGLQLDLATFQLLTRAKSAEHFKQEGEFQVAGSFVKEASDYETAAGKLNTLFLTLACVLQNGGIANEY